MAEQSLGDFLSGLQGQLIQKAQSVVPLVGSPQPGTTKSSDEKLRYFCTPAANAIEWATEGKFLGVDTLWHHRRQYQLIRDFFQLRCPLSSCNSQTAEAIDPWDKGREYLQAETLLVHSATYGEDVCPKCGSTRTELTDDGLLKQNNQMHVVAGMRSGKTATAAIMGTFIEHKVITIAHSIPGGLSKYFDQLNKQPFEMSFIASTEVQSADTIWAKFVGLRSGSPWIEEYVRWLKQLQLAQQTPDGVKPWKYEERDKYIINELIGFKLNSLNSNSNGMAGRTRIASCIDELSRFEDTDGARGSDEAYRVLENSLRTVRSKATKNKLVPWMGTMISISSPISADDKAMRLLKDAPRIKGMYYGHYATWDFNPDQPREMFDADFEKDPAGAMRDFGARPPTAASPYIVDPERFRQLVVDDTIQPTTSFRQIVHTDRTGREYVSAVIDQTQMVRNGERYICFDAGSSFDQFAAACAHGEWVHTPEGKQLVTVFDWVFRLVPENKPKRDVWFDFVIGIIERLSKNMFVARVEFDRWQSTALIQQIRSRGVNCEMSGTTVDHFNKFLNDANYSKVRMLPPLSTDHKSEPLFMSPQGLAFYELERLERSMDMKRIYNPMKGARRGYNSDDVATVIVHANYMVQAAISDPNATNTMEARLRRESASAQNWNGGGRLFRPVLNRRGW
jgi:hypothetical protein